MLSLIGSLVSEERPYVAQSTEVNQMDYTRSLTNYKHGLTCEPAALRHKTQFKPLKSLCPGINEVDELVETRHPESSISVR